MTADRTEALVGIRRPSNEIGRCGRLATVVGACAVALILPASAPAQDTTPPASPDLAAPELALMDPCGPRYSVALNWSSVVDASGIVRYEVSGFDRSIAGTFGAFSAGSVSAQVPQPARYLYRFDDPARLIKPGRPYDFSVHPVDGAGNRGASNVRALSVPVDGQAPSAVGALSGTVLSDRSTRLTWTAATDDVGVCSYVITRNGAVIATVGASITSFTAPAPPPGAVSSSYAVAARDSLRPGPASVIQIAHPPLPGPGPAPAPPAVSLPAIGSEPTCAYRSTRLSAQYRAQIVLASVCLANFERVSRGIAPMYVDARLGAAAQGHADDQVRRNFFSHTNPDGCTFLCRADAAGYSLALGENISAGRFTAGVAVRGWMDSPGHKANLLTQGFRTMGAGSAVGGPYGSQWVHIFGILPPAAGSVHGLEAQFQGREDPTKPLAMSAKLQVRRAQVKGGALDVLADISRRADGHRLTVTFKTRGVTSRFMTPVKRGRIDVDRRLSPAQRGARSGIVTLHYAGDEGVRPAEVRLRAAGAKAELRRRTLSLSSGVLSATGTISKRARGIVRMRMEFDTPTGPGEWHGRAAIANGRWSLRQTLPPAAMRGGYLSLQFTGYGLRGMRGEQIGKQVTG